MTVKIINLNLQKSIKTKQTKPMSYKFNLILKMMSCVHVLICAVIMMKCKSLTFLLYLNKRITLKKQKEKNQFEDRFNSYLLIKSLL